MRRRHAVLAVVIVVLLLAAAFAIGMRFGDDERDEGEVTVLRPTSTSPLTPVEGGASGLPGAPGEAPGTATFTATARSLVVDRASTSMQSISLRPRRGDPSLRFSGRVHDASGRDLGTGTVVVNGLATVKGTLTLTAVFSVTPDAFVLGSEGAAEPELSAKGVVTVDGASLTFARHRTDGPPEHATPVTGPLRVEEGALMTVGGGTEWTAPPPDVTATTRGRATVSWAGSGEVELRDGRTITSSFGGVKGTSLRVTFRREGGAVVAGGEVQPQQIYADGLPQLPARAGVSLKRAPGPVRSGGGGEFTWAPFNQGAVDMVMTKIRPGNDLARSVNLALETLPAMCGAETCPFGELGGDTSGLGNRGGLFGGGASPINAVILPGTGDERRISFNLPNGIAAGNHEMVLIVEGNFAPITVRIPVTVSG